MKSKAPAASEKTTGTSNSDQTDPTSVAVNGLSVPELPAGVDALTAALAYARCGWYVVPVRRGSKHPGSGGCPESRRS